MADATQGVFLGPLCAFCASVTWAIGSARYSQLTKDNSAFSVNFSRALVGLPLFILASFIMSGGFYEGLSSFMELRLSHFGWFTLSMLASYGLGDALFLLSARTLGVPGALAIGSSYPILTVMAGYFFGNESISLVQFLGLIITSLGIAIIILNGPEKAALNKSKKTPFPLSGVLLAFATSIAWATNGFAISKAGVGISPSVGNTVRMGIALVLSSLMGQVLTPKKPIFLPFRDVTRFYWVFVLEAFGGSYFYLYGMTHSPLALGASLTSLAPAISVPVAVISGLERFSMARTLGVFLVVGGICLLLSKSLF